MSKANKLRVEGNCLPVSIAKYNLLWYIRESKELPEGIRKQYADAAKSCNDILIENIMSLPTYYRDSSSRRVDSLTKEIYFKYMVKNQFDTGKVFMVLHNWVISLCNDELIDEPDEAFVALIESLNQQIDKGLTGGYKDDGITPNDIEKQYLSAMKRVKKIHKIAVDAGLFTPVDIIEIAA